MWCAGWLGDPEDMGDDFIKWLRDDYAKYRSRTEEWELLDFEVAGLPPLRRLYAEVFGAGQLEDRTEAVIDSNSPPSYRTIEIPEAIAITVTDESLTAELRDGRTISVPLSWYPRLTHATPEERNNWELIGTGEGIHWPDLDEDISVEMLLAGVPSGESQGGFKRWLEAKQAGPPGEHLRDKADGFRRCLMRHPSENGAIPADWRQVRLGDVATLQRGIDLPEADRIAGEIPVYGSNGLLGHHNSSPIDGPGVITGRSGSIGIVYYSETAYWPLNTTLYVKDFHGKQ